ncbi:30S ribosomal protein S6 [bacterium]|jgi:small subunit ribosomal protein S6|nr:30S ribosomal protein S6 [bacterium]MBT5492682.1 30S ribosomal protein S6 [bacterium]
MINYELMTIVDPTISEEERNASIDELKALLKKNSVKIEKEDVWGDKKMAYKINGSDRGFYTLYDLDMDGKLISQISKTMNLNKSIWRYMFVKKEA